VTEGAPWSEAGERWRRLEVTFDGSIDTHSARQVFYYDARGLLRRHDYAAEVVGRHARVAHYCAEHAIADGLVLPTRRRIVPLGWGNQSLRFPTLIGIELSDLHVESDESRRLYA
jgi:hypothetical protein